MTIGGAWERYSGGSIISLYNKYDSHGPLVERLDSLLPSWSAGAFPSDEYDADRRVAIAYGWPTLALRGFFNLNALNSHHVLVMHDENGNFRALLPFGPILPGFAINTIFYAAVIWVLCAVPGKVRRWRRIKRGLCPRCAYPVGESSTCTECGKPLNPTAIIARNGQG
jgi:hypothetical protein